MRDTVVSPKVESLIHPRPGGSDGPVDGKRLQKTNWLDFQWKCPSTATRRRARLPGHGEFRRGAEGLRGAEGGEVRAGARAVRSAGGVGRHGEADAPWLAEGEPALAAGDVGTAGARFDAVLERNPALPEVYFGLARLALFAGEVSAATVHATAATKLAPKSGGRGRCWAWCTRRNGAAKALELLEKGKALSPSDFLCRVQPGPVPDAQGRAEKGVGGARGGTRLEKNESAGFIALGVAYERAGATHQGGEALGEGRVEQSEGRRRVATLADVHFAHRYTGRRARRSTRASTACRRTPRRCSRRRRRSRWWRPHHGGDLST